MRDASTIRARGFVAEGARLEIVARSPDPVDVLVKMAVAGFSFTIDGCRLMT